MFVSVVIPAYNAEPFLREAVDSTLGQTHADFELILADDGSTDRTLEIAREYESRDGRVRVLTHPNWGIGHTLNHAIELSQSNWIARMDADDVMEPNRLERQVAFIAEHEDLAVTGTLVRHIDSSGRIIGASDPMLTSDEEVDVYREAGGIIGFHHPTVMMRKDIVQQVGGYRQEFWPAEDMDLWSRIVYSGARVLIQPEYLLRYRVHGQATSTRIREYREQVRWIEDCICRRKHGLPESTRDEFIQAYNEQSFLHRMSDYRKDLAWVLLRKAMFNFGDGQRVRPALFSGLAGVLDPMTVIPRLWRKLDRDGRQVG